MRLIYTVLALASRASLVGGEILFDGSSNAENQQPARLGLPDRVTEERNGVEKDLAKYPLPAPSQCDAWTGVEVIYMVEVTEICPEGSTVTETSTQCVSTLTRSICATRTTNRPCYPCIFSTPAPTDDTVTVTVTSCPTAAKPTVTVTIQLCSTCPATTYIGTVPGYTPGGPCHDCSPYSSATSPSPDTSTITAITTTASTTTDVPGCTQCPGTSSVTESRPGGGDSGVPDDGSSTTPGEVVTEPATETSATNTPYRPTAAPPVTTAGSGRNVAVKVWFGILMVGCAVLGVF